MKGLSGAGNPTVRLLSKEVAATFSMETVWHDRLLGYSRVNRWPLEKVELVDEWCSEHRIATTDLHTPRRQRYQGRKSLGLESTSVAIYGTRLYTFSRP